MVNIRPEGNCLRPQFWRYLVLIELPFIHLHWYDLFDLETNKLSDYDIITAAAH